MASHATSLSNSRDWLFTFFLAKKQRVKWKTIYIQKIYLVVNLLKG